MPVSRLDSMALNNFLPTTDIEQPGHFIKETANKLGRKAGLDPEAVLTKARDETLYKKSRESKPATLFKIIRTMLPFELRMYIAAIHASASSDLSSLLEKERRDQGGDITDKPSWVEHSLEEIFQKATSPTEPWYSCRTAIRFCALSINEFSEKEVQSLIDNVCSVADNVHPILPGGMIVFPTSTKGDIIHLARAVIEVSPAIKRLSISQCQQLISVLKSETHAWHNQSNRDHHQYAISALLKQHEQLFAKDPQLEQSIVGIAYEHQRSRSYAPSYILQSQLDELLNLERIPLNSSIS